MLCLIVFGCQYQCNWLPGKTCLRNDLLCVKWDVRPYTLTHSVVCVSVSSVTFAVFVVLFVVEVTAFSLTWKVMELIWSRKIREFCWWPGKMICIIRVACLLFSFVEKNGNTHLVLVITKWRWKGVGVGEEKLTRNYIKLVLAPQIGQGIMPNTVVES